MRSIRSRASFAALVVLGLGAALPARAAAPADPVFDSARAHEAGALELLKSIVDIDSGTGDVAGGRAVLDVLEPRLRALGAETRRVPPEVPGLSDALVAQVSGTGRGRILMIAHLDTVFGPGTAARRPFRIENGRAYGPGVGDEKAGVTAAVTALEMLKALGFHDFGRITLLIDNSEERGSPGATKLIEALSREADVELNMEPGDPPDDITVWRKGSTNVKIHVAGLAAHAGMAPERGRNAASELVHQIDLLSPKFPIAGPQTTVNLTGLRAGERSNIIPDDAEANFNVRFRTPEALTQVVSAAEADARTPAIAGTTVTVSTEGNFPPLREDAATRGLAERASLIYRRIGRALGLSGNGGASESALAQAVGTPALDGLGFVGSDFHTDHEWIDLSTVAPRLYLVTELLMDLGRSPPPRDDGR